MGYGLYGTRKRQLNANILRKNNLRKLQKPDNAIPICRIVRPKWPKNNGLGIERYGHE